jgi:hypothetical protein
MTPTGATSPSISILMQGNGATGSNAFSFDAPVLTRMLTPNGPTTGGAVLTLIGTNFRSLDSTSSVFLDRSGCLTSTWTSNSAISCVHSFGAGTATSVIVVSTSDMGSFNSGTLPGSPFSYDAPVLTNVEPSNCPMTGSTTLSIFGTNFSPAAAQSASIGATSCATVQWVATTSIACQQRAGWGKALGIWLTASGLTGCLIASVTFDAPVVSISPSNVPASPTRFLPLAGFNFGATDACATVTLGGSRCAGSYWLSDSSMMCLKEASGQYGANQYLVVDAMQLVGTSASRLSYDAPVLTSSRTPNLPITGEASITLSGMNLGIVDQSLQLGIEAGLALTTSWLSSTTILARSRGGASVGAAAFVSSNGFVSGTFARAFTFDAPTVSAVYTGNGPLSGRALISITGAGFDPTVTFSIGYSVCLTSTWTSQTSAICSLPPKSNPAMGLVNANIATLVGSAIGAFSYDAPVGTLVTPNNAPGIEGLLLSIRGTNFGNVAGAVVLIGSTRCMSSLWQSMTEIVCQIPKGSGTQQAIGFEFNSLRAYTSLTLTYDSVVVTYLYPANSPAKGQAAITMYGQNFGPPDSGLRASVGQTWCSCTQWLTATSARCTVPLGVGLQQALALNLDGALRRAPFMLSYDAARIAAVSPPNGPTKGGATVSVLGSNFGTFDSSITSAIGGTVCRTSSWETDTSVRCGSPAGLATPQSAVVTVGLTVGTIVSVFSYNAPVQTAFVVPNFPSTGSSILTVNGVNFGLLGSSPVVSVGVTSCISSWVSDSSLLCASAAGYGIRVTSKLSILNQDHIGSFALSFDAPVVTSQISAFGRNMPASGYTSFTLHGFNFAPADATPTVNIGGPACQTAAWSSVTSITCSPAMYGANEWNKATVGSGIGTASSLFSFDAPVISRIVEAEAVTILGSKSITLDGANFGTENSSPQAKFGNNVGWTTSWVSSTSMTSQLILGFGMGDSTEVRLIGHTTVMGRKAFTSAPSISPATAVPQTSPFTGTDAPADFSSTNFCSGPVILLPPSGAFSDGSGSGSYRSNMDCSWSLVYDGTITLTFSQVSLESGYDFVKVFAGASLLQGSAIEPLQVLTGEMSTVPQIQVSSSVLITFHSDASGNGGGFTANYSSSPRSNATQPPTSYLLLPQEKCQGIKTLFDTAGVVGSGPETYFPNSRCTWKFAPDLQQIELTFQTFQTERGYDYLEVWTNETLVAALSGTEVPSPIRGPAAWLRLVFTSDATVQSTGFVLQYRATTFAPTSAPSSGNMTTVPSFVGNLLRFWHALSTFLFRSAKLTSV